MNTDGIFSEQQNGDRLNAYFSHEAQAPTDLREWCKGVDKGIDDLLGESGAGMALEEIRLFGYPGYNDKYRRGGWHLSGIVVEEIGKSCQR